MLDIAICIAFEHWYSAVENRQSNHWLREETMN